MVHQRPFSSTYSSLKGYLLLRGAPNGPTSHILSIFLTDKTPFKDLFIKSNFSINKEIDGFYEPSLFDV